MFFSLQDRNDNAPVVNLLDTEITREETTPIGTVLTRATAFDADTPVSTICMICHSCNILCF